MSVELKTRIERGANVPSPGIVRGLLRSWLDVMKRFHEAQRDDWPYWYTERSNCSMLAAAAWTQGIAIEEFDVKRKRKPGGKARNGRCDLWIKIGSLDCAMEFKQLWPSRCSESFVGDLRDALSESKDQLSTFPKTPTRTWHFAGCFVVPGVSVAAAPEHPFAGFANLCRQVVAGSRSAICSLEAGRDRSTQFNDKGVERSYPGVILVGEFV